ncbi:MAG: N-acetyltransferase [Gammaproteobacteria bacterium]|nr:N-acetyltransferase [Gammaproteobacteria bacterium]
MGVSGLNEYSKLKIRESKESDRSAIDAIHMNAFGQPEGREIVDLVNDLLEDETAKPLLSLVAERGGKLAGHVLFTTARLQPGNEATLIRILAPLAISSENQGEGIGGGLIKEGLKRLAESGVDLVFVLGHPQYYPKFGFQTAGLLGFEAPHTIPAEHADAWMVQALKPDGLAGKKGRVQCSKILNQPQHWRE